MTLRLFKSNPVSICFKEKTLPDGKIEVEIPNEVQLMKTGSFTYWDPGDMEITQAHFIAMVNNFEKNVRGVDCAIDYAHNMFGRAAGWIKKLYTSSNGNELWAEISWTPDGAKALAEKEYRYFSAEFSYHYQDQPK